MTMLEVRVHGRGGQGVVTTAELLAAAAFAAGHHPQAFPSFGSERSGAPVVAYCRVDDRPIRAHDPVAEPGVVLVQDPTLLHHVPVLDGLRAGGLVLVNSERAPDDLGLGELPGAPRVRTVPASAIGRRHLGRPLPGAALLGALAAHAEILDLDALDAVLHERFPGPIGESNAAAARAAYDQEVRHVTHA